MDPIRVRGVLIVGQRAVLRRLAGPARYQRALERASAAESEEYESCTVLSWCDQRAARGVTLAAAAELGVNPAQLAGDIVAESVSNAFSGPWGIMLGRLVDDESILHRAPFFFSKSFDRGELRGELIGDGRAKLHLRGWPDPHVMDLISFARGAEAMLRALGRSAAVTYQTRADEVEFSVITRQSLTRSGGDSAKA